MSNVLLDGDRMCLETAIRLAAGCDGDFQRVMAYVASSLRPIMASSWRAFTAESLQVSNLQLAKAHRTMAEVCDPHGYMPGLPRFQAVLTQIAPQIHLLTEQAA